jgi:copper chaperone CopZ
MTTEVFTMKGGTCASCAYAIEHRGRKLEGIEDIRVFADKSEMQVVHHSPEAVDKLLDYIRMIGYEAESKEKTEN